MVYRVPDAFLEKHSNCASIIIGPGGANIKGEKNTEEY
jgi:hypothetical protein